MRFGGSCIIHDELYPVSNLLLETMTLYVKPLVTQTADRTYTKALTPDRQ